MNYPVFPIYTAIIRWEEDGVQDPEYPNMYVGLEPGRIHNSTSDKYMFKEEIPIETLKERVNLEFESFRKDKNITNLQIEFKPVEYESWMCTWFAHQTIDIGQTDEEILDSFEQYVRKYEHFENRSDWSEAFKEPGYKPLMGAQDRWRWRGVSDDGEETPAPCRCTHCKNSGMVRINH